MATASISPRDCRSGPNQGNPDIRPGLRSGLQQAIHWVRLPRPTALEERRQPGDRLSRSSSRRGDTATRIASRCEGEARYACSPRATCSGRPLFRLGMVQRAATPKRGDDHPGGLLVSDQRVQRPQPHLVSMARHAPPVHRYSAGPDRRGPSRIEGACTKREEGEETHREPDPREAKCDHVRVETAVGDFHARG